MADTKLPRPRPATIEDAKIIFRNFAGAEGQYNRAGDRNFAVILTEEKAAELEDAGWNVKRLNPRDDDEVGSPYLKVSVSYRVKPPRVVMVTSRGRNALGEEEVAAVDFATIDFCDMILDGSPYEINGRTGIKAYLKSIFVNIIEDELDLKYADIPDLQLESSTTARQNRGPRFEEDEN